MFINPIVAIEEGWITHPKCSTLDDWKANQFISPNAIDFTLDRLFDINSQKPFRISENGKEMRGSVELMPLTGSYFNKNGVPYWTLHEKQSYDGVSDLFIEVPQGVAAMLIIRSTFNRNGLFLTSGLYDQGFSGNIGFVLHNLLGVSYITPGTRVGQLLLFRSEDSGIMYAGGYNHEAGTHWTEK